MAFLPSWLPRYRPRSGETCMVRWTSSLILFGGCRPVTSSPQLAVQALNEVAKLLSKLTEPQLVDLVEGRALIEFRSAEVSVTSRATRRAPALKAAPLDLDDVVGEI